jgi:hypothetical protein
MEAKIKEAEDAAVALVWKGKCSGLRIVTTTTASGKDVSVRTLIPCPFGMVLSKSNAFLQHAKIVQCLSCAKWNAKLQTLSVN